MVVFGMEGLLLYMIHDIHQSIVSFFSFRLYSIIRVCSLVTAIRPAKSAYVFGDVASFHHVIALVDKFPPSDWPTHYFLLFFSFLYRESGVR